MEFNIEKWARLIMHRTKRPGEDQFDPESHPKRDLPLASIPNNVSVYVENFKRLHIRLVGRSIKLQTIP